MISAFRSLCVNYAACQSGFHAALTSSIEPKFADQCENNHARQQGELAQRRLYVSFYLYGPRWADILDMHATQTDAG